MDSEPEHSKEIRRMLVDNYSVFYVIKGDFALCTLFYETAIKNEVKGRAAEIVETGFEFGLSENDILERLQRKLNVSLQTAQEYIRMFGKQTV